MSSEQLEVFENKNTISLMRQSDDLVEQIVNENDPTKLADLTELFKLNQFKKNALRSNKLNKLLDVIDDEVAMRVATNPEQISDRNLINYMNSTQQAVNNTLSSLDNKPLIQINNQEINVTNNTSGLDRASRQRVLDAVAALLQEAKSGTDVIDVEEEDA